MKRLIALLLVCLMLSLAFTGCGESPAGPGEAEKLLAETLTRHIAQSVLTIETDGNGSWDLSEEEWNPDEFLFTNAFFREEAGYRYRENCVQDEEFVYHFPAEAAAREIYEVFGTENYQMSLPLSADGKDYLSGLEFGFGSQNQAENIKVEPGEEAGTLAAVFDLVPGGGIGEAGTEPYGTVRILYRVMSEEGETFLRFLSAEKIS